MILAIDIGNTNVVVGCIDDDKILFVERISTDLSRTELEYAISLKTLLEINHISVDSITGTIIGSVVPPLNNIMKRAVVKVSGQNPLLVGENRFKHQHGRSHTGGSRPDRRCSGRAS